MFKRFVIGSLLLALLLPAAAWAETPVREPLPVGEYAALSEETAPEQAYLLFVPNSDVFYLQDFGDETEGWQFSFFFRETHGVPFTIELLQKTVYDERGDVVDFCYFTREELTNFGYDCELKDGSIFEFAHRIENQPECRRVGYVAEGTDANGVALRFGGLLELAPERLPVLAPEDFTQLPAPEGEIDVTVSFTPNPIPLRYEETWQDYFWRYSVQIRNTGSAAVTAKSWTTAFFNGETMTYRYDLSGYVTAEWCEENDAVLEPGESWTMDMMEPQADMTAIGSRLTVTDENGKEASFAGYATVLYETEEQ